MTKKKQAHTPGPWKAKSAFVCNAPNVNVITDGKWGSPHIAEVDTPENAARIVACVNACEGIADPSVVPEMLEALSRMARCMERYKINYGKDPDAGDAITMAYDVITKAEGRDND